MTKSAVGCMSEWSGVLKDFFRQIDDGSHKLEAIKAFNAHRNPFAPIIPIIADVGGVLANWQVFWQESGFTDADFSNIKIPQLVPGLTRAIVVPQGHTLNREYELCEGLFPCGRWTEDLDKAVTENERDPQAGSYLIWVRDVEEADEELKNFSANDIKKKKLTTETLLERMIHERKFFKETGRHLDVPTVTLCSGSRLQDGRVPSPGWSRDWFRVGWYGPDYSYGSLRSRQVVS